MPGELILKELLEQYREYIVMFPEHASFWKKKYTLIKQKLERIEKEHNTLSNKGKE